MIASQFVVYLISLSLLPSLSSAYALSRHSFQSRKLRYLTSTCLRASAKPEEGPQKEEHDGALSAQSTTDILSSPAFLKRKLDVLKSDLAAAEKDIEEAKKRMEEGKKEWGQQIDALQTEYQNIQQRMNTQSNQGDSMATVQVTRAMLEVLDNFDRAFGSVTAETDEEKAIETEYKRSYDMILDTFKKLGVEEVETVGTEFNFEVHQAVMQKPSEYEEGIVCEQFQKGFKLGKTLVRAAMVAVAA